MKLLFKKQVFFKWITQRYLSLRPTW